MLPVAPRPPAGPRREAMEAERRVSSLMAAMGSEEDEDAASVVSTAGVMAGKNETKGRRRQGRFAA